MITPTITTTYENRKKNTEMCSRNSNPPIMIRPTERHQDSSTAKIGLPPLEMFPARLTARPSTARHRSTKYVPTKEHDPTQQQEIVTERTNVLLRYLHQQWDKKAGQQKKREAEAAAAEAGATAAAPIGAPATKKSRTDPLASNEDSNRDQRSRHPQH